jgi:hypothetical protein
LQTRPQHFCRHILHYCALPTLHALRLPAEELLFPARQSCSGTGLENASQFSVAPWTCRKTGNNNTLVLFYLGRHFLTFASHLYLAGCVDGRQQLCDCASFLQPCVIESNQAYLLPSSIAVAGDHVFSVATNFGRALRWRRCPKSGRPEPERQQQPSYRSRSPTASSARPHGIHVVCHTVIFSQSAG